MKDRSKLIHSALAFSFLAIPPVVSAQKKPVTQPLVVAAIVGQTVIVLPVTMVVSDPSVPTGTLIAERPGLLRWADSLIALSFAERAPEVKWVLPPELRRKYRRGGGVLVPDPDHLGQSLMRTWGLTTVPDPLRSNLRRLTASTEGRYVFIPASLVFAADSSGALRAELSAVLADARTGRVVWRSIARGAEGTPDQVLGKALATIFPVETAQ